MFWKLGEYFWVVSVIKSFQRLFHNWPIRDFELFKAAKSIIQTLESKYRAAERFLSFRILTFLWMYIFFWMGLLGLVGSIEATWHTQWQIILYNLYFVLWNGLLLVVVKIPKNCNIYFFLRYFWKIFVDIIWPFW